MMVRFTYLLPRALTLLTCILLSNSSLQAQMTLSTSIPPQTMAANNFGAVLTNISNVDYHGQWASPGPSQFGSFLNYTVSRFSFSQGIVLSTGNVTSISGNSTIFLNDYTLVESDTSLENLTGNQYTNTASLEFDFQTFSDTVSFRIIFASEEYNQQVCNKVTDGMGVFLFGPGLPAEGVNMALVPGTNYNIGINSINNGSPGGGQVSDSCESLGYSSLFVENYPSGNLIAFDGFTEAIRIKHAVIPCTTYHIKFVVADAPDAGFDSGLFIEAISSFTCIPYFDTELSSNSGDTISENNGQVKCTLHLPCNTADSIYEHIELGGTAINGIDYIALPDSILIPANTDSGYFYINPISDGLTEDAESIIISYQYNCSSFQKDTLWISDSLFTSLPENKQNQTFSGVLYIYPNPASDILNIFGMKTESVWEITDITGRVILTGNFEDKTGRIHLDTIQNGIYFLRIDYGKEGILRFVKR